MPNVPPTSRADELPAAYPQFLAEIKARIGAARTRAVLAVNSELIQLYWEIGHEILERQEREGWGAGVIKRLGFRSSSGVPRYHRLLRVESTLHAELRARLGRW